MQIDFNGPAEEIERFIDKMQTDNIAILFAALKKIDANISEAYPDADNASRVATYLTSMDMAIALFLDGVRDASKKEIFDMTVAMYQTLIGANRVAWDARNRDISRKESLEFAKKLAEEFSKNAG